MRILMLGTALSGKYVLIVINTYLLNNAIDELKYIDLIRGSIVHIKIPLSLLRVDCWIAIRGIARI